MFTFYVILNIFLLFILSTTPTKSGENVNPYDLEDEVREKVEELKSIVRGRIYSAFNEIDTFVREVYYFRDDRLNEAEISIGQEHEALKEQITTLKELAQSVGQNVDVCLANGEPQLEQLPYDIIDSLLECLAFSNREVTIIQNESRYRIDTLMTEVNIFDFELDLCSGDMLCISPLFTQIELAAIEIPQKIGIEVQRAYDLADELKVLIQQCTADKVGQYVAEGGIIVNQISSCINDLLS